MAESIFSQAGFDLPKAASSLSAPSVAPDEGKPASGGGLFESAGFDVSPKKDKAPSWQDIEALENATALGINMAPPTAAEKKPGRGIVRAILDYPAHVASGLLGLVKAPGEVLASETPSTTENLIPTAVGLAGLTTGHEFPRVGTGPIAEAAIEHLAPTTRAVNELVKAVGPENVPELVTRLQSNPRLSVADVSDPVRTMVQGLVDPAQPKVQNLVAQTVKERQATLPSAINSAYTEAMGHAPDVVQMVEGLKARAQEAGKNIIEPAIENAQPVPTKPLLRQLDKMIASPEAIAGETPRIPLTPTQVRLLNLRRDITTGDMAPLNERVGLSVGPINDAIKNGGLGKQRSADFTEARRLLNSARRGFTDEEDLVSGLKDLAKKQKISGPIDDALAMIQKGPAEMRGADFLHGIQSRLREEAQSLSKSSSGSDRLMANDLFDARDKIVSAIDKAAGGDYRPGLAKYREAKQIHEAFDEGFDVLKNRSGVNGLQDRPEALREWMKTATPEEVVAKRLGVRSDIDQKIRGVKNQALAGQNITKIEYNQEKLRTLFGDKEANRLIRVMNDAADEAATNAKLLAGSKTAETLAGREALKVRQTDAKNPMGYMLPAMTEMVGSQYGIPGVGAGLMALRMGHLGAQKVGQLADLARNYRFAKGALATGAERDSIVSALLAHPKVVRALEKRSKLLAAP